MDCAQPDFEHYGFLILYCRGDNMNKIGCIVKKNIENNTDFYRIKYDLKIYLKEKNTLFL